MLTKKKLIAILTVAALSTTMLTCTAAAENEPDVTEAIVTEAPETEAPETEAPETEATENEVPETEAPEEETTETTKDDSFPVTDVVEERREGTYYYSYDTSNYTCKITDFSAETTDMDIVIPEAFTYNNVAYTVTGIGNDAFSGCGSIVSIKIPDAVEYIGKFAFRNCTSLKSVSIGNDVTSIGDYAFQNCKSLESITIPQNVNTIGTQVFNNCIKLKSINVPSGNETFKSVDGVLFNKELTQLLAYPIGNPDIFYSIPYGVRLINDNAFYNCDILVNIEIPDTVITIGNYAFFDSDALTSIAIPDSVSSINECAFQYCDSLSTVVIGSGVTSIGYRAFYDCNIKSVYYTGSQINWNHISIDSGNYVLTNAPRTYNYIPSPMLTSIKVSSGNNVTLTWSKVGQATSYRVYRSTALNGTKTRLGAVTATTFTDTATAPGMKYYYFVTSYNSASGSESPFSESLNVKLPSAPAKPTGVTAVSGGGNATIAWNAASGATSYRVYRSTSPTGAKTRVAIRTSTYYIDKNASTGLTYYYWVQAYNANTGLSSNYSDYSYASIVNTFDRTPIIKSASVLSTSVTLKWDIVPGATSYQIFRRKDNGDRQLIATQSANEFRDSGLTKGKVYRYEIRAYSSKTRTTTAFSPIKLTRPMAAPTIQSGNVLGKITWDKNAVATSYRVYRADSLTGKKTLLAPTKLLSYTDRTAVSGRTYYYFVAAYDNTTGTLSAYSQPKVIKIS